MRRYRFLIIALCFALCIPSFAFATSGLPVGDQDPFTFKGYSWAFNDNVYGNYTFDLDSGTVTTTGKDWQYDPQGFFYIPPETEASNGSTISLVFNRRQANFAFSGSTSNYVSSSLKYARFDTWEEFDNLTNSDLMTATTLNTTMGSAASSDYIYYQFQLKNKEDLSYTSGISFRLTGLNQTYYLPIYWIGGLSDKPKESLLNTSVGSGSGASTSVIAVLPGFGCVIENGTNTQFELTFDGSTKKYNGGSFYSGQRAWASNAWLSDFQLNRFAETEENIKWNSDGSLLHRSASGSALISVPSGRYTYFVNPAQYIEYGQSVYNNGNMFIRPIGGNAKLVKTFRLGNPSNTDNAEDNAFEITMHDDTQFYEIGSYNGQDSQYYPSDNSQNSAYDSSYSGTPVGYNQYQLPSGGGISADEIGSFNDNTSAINQFLSDATQNASSIQQNASGFFETMRNMFSWLPDEIISLLIAFISIVLIVGLFKVFL